MLFKLQAMQTPLFGQTVLQSGLCERSHCLVYTVLLYTFSLLWTLGLGNKNKHKEKGFHEANFPSLAAQIALFKNLSHFLGDFFFFPVLQGKSLRNL